MSLFNELKQRNVFRVGVAYVIGAWLLAQIADLLIDNIGAPDWVMKTLFVVLGLGFFLALFFAWAFEMTPDGIKKEKDVDRSQSIRKETGHNLNYGIIGILALVAIYFFWEARFDREPMPESTETIQVAAPETTAEPTEADTQTVDDKSVAVLPFVNMSSDPEQEYFSDGITEEIINALVKIPGLSVPARTSVFGFKGHQGDVREIGQQLNVAYILEGSIRSQAKQVRITAQLIKVDDGFHLWSETFDRQLDNIFVVQEEIAGAIAEVLVGKLGTGINTVPNKTVNMEAYDAYLNGRALLRERKEGMIAELERATQLDPDFVPAWAALAMAYQVKGYYVASGADLQRKARETAQYALSIDPQNIDALDALASAERALWNWTEAEKHFDVALAIDPNSSELLEDYSELLLGTGRVKEAAAVTTRGYALDPNLQPLRDMYVTALTLTGKYQQALTNRGQEPDDVGLSWMESDLQVGRGMNLDIYLSMDNVVGAVDRLQKIKPVTAEVTASINLLKDPFDKQAMEILTSTNANHYPNGFWFAESLKALIPAYLGEAEYVIDMILEIDRKSEWGEPMFLWNDTWRQVRAHPRFVEVLTLYKLPEYWDQVGWPDYCQRTDKGITCQ